MFSYVTFSLTFVFFEMNSSYCNIFKVGDIFAVIWAVNREQIQDSVEITEFSVMQSHECISRSVFMNMQFYLSLLLDLPPPSPVGFEDAISIQEQLPGLHNSPHLNGI